MNKSFPFLSDTLIPKIGEKMPVNHRNAQAFVYPMTQFPKPRTMCVGGVIVPTDTNEILRQYVTGTAQVEMYPLRDTSKAILDVLKATEGSDCPEPLPEGERICVAFLRGYLWFCVESDAREMGAKTYSDWYNAGKPFDPLHITPETIPSIISQSFPHA